jgi:hypothetical protein
VAGNRQGSVAFYDRDGRLRQIPASRISKTWPLPGKEPVPIPGDKFAIADEVWQGPEDLWLLRAVNESWPDVVVRISPDRAAQWLIDAGHGLPDELKPYGTPLPDGDQALPARPAGFMAAIEPVTLGTAANQGKPATEASRKGKTGDPPTLDTLKPTAWKLLGALRDLGAIDSEKAARRDKITAKARKGNHDSKHNQEAFEQLSDLGLISARRNVGKWITQVGIDALNKRSISG